MRPRGLCAGRCGQVRARASVALRGQCPTDSGEPRASVLGAAHAANVARVHLSDLQPTLYLTSAVAFADVRRVRVETRRNSCWRTSCYLRSCRASSRNRSLAPTRARSLPVARHCVVCSAARAGTSAQIASACGPKLCCWLALAGRRCKLGEAHGSRWPAAARARSSEPYEGRLPNRVSPTGAGWPLFELKRRGALGVWGEPGPARPARRHLGRTSAARRAELG